MILLKISLILLAACTCCLAQANFGFAVSDEVKDEKLHYEFIQDVTVNDTGPDDPILSYRTDCGISGINQKEFSVTTERFQGTIPRKDYIALMDRAKELLAEDPKDRGDRGTSGWITINARSHHFSASPSSEERKRWQTFIDGILTKHAPASERKKVTRSIQGDGVAPVVVSFAELLKDPEKYDDKRIRISGFYDGEFVGTSSPPGADGIRNVEEALWLGMESSFADSRKIARTTGRAITIEGTFESRPGSHLGQLKAGIARITARSDSESGTTGQPAND